MRNLIKGLHKFQKEVFPKKKRFFEGLVKGQNPEVLFITCSDSRVNPNLVTSSDPGDLFILRNAGNIIPPYNHHGFNYSESATIEFAVSKLKIKDIVVCGHSHCGAIDAVMDLSSLGQTPSLYSWIKTHMEPSLELVKENYQDLDKESFMNVLIQENVLKQIENLKTHPAVESAIEKEGLLIHAWLYTFETGEILSYDVTEGQFGPMNY